MTKAELMAEVERLKEKCDRQAMVLRRIYVEHNPDTWFPCGQHGGEDRNGLPEFITICPAYGVGWSQVYQRTDRTVGGM